MLDILIYGIIYAFIGWIIEVFFYVYKTKKFVNRGFLNGPLVPIYGLSMIGLHLLISYFVLDYTLSFEHIALTVVTIIVVSTVLELIGGSILYTMFGIRWWDYSKEKYHYKGYISLKYSIIWGVLGTLGYLLHIYVITPLVEGVPYNIRFIITINLMALIAIDMFFTIKALINFKSLVNELKIRTQNFDSLTDRIKSKLPEPLKNQVSNFRLSIRNNETLNTVHTKVKGFKSKLTKLKDKATITEYTALYKITEKLTNTRFYKAFPEARISLKRIKKENDTHDEL